MQCHTILTTHPLFSPPPLLPSTLVIRSVNGRRLWAILSHGTGDHKGCIQVLSEALTHDPTNLECLYLLASCQHAVGLHREAAMTYEKAMKIRGETGGSVLQVLAFYQRQVALYTATKLNRPITEFQLDEDMSPRFKVS